MSFYLDLAVIIVVTIAMVNGYLKGLVRTFMEFISVLLSAVGANLIAITYREPFAAFFISGGIRSALKGGPPVANSEKLFNMSDILSSIGLPADVAQGIGGAIGDKMTSATSEALDMMSDAVATHATTVFSVPLSYLLLFVVSFVLLNSIFKIVILAVDTFFKLPVLSLLNHTGGLMLGVIQGIIICALICIAISFLISLYAFDPSAPFGLSDIDKTILLRHIYNSSIVKRFWFG